MMMTMMAMMTAMMMTSLTTTTAAQHYHYQRYQEKYYFTPGDSGFLAWDTAYGRVGAAVCWDQWFPESARALALQGAEVGE
jgi:predicted amidohydrolase